MASAKETPRQKLIGIMYLILLALLALQVSSAIMEKFKFLDDNMQYTNGQMKKNSDELGMSIEKNVVQMGNKDTDLKLLEKSKQIRKQSEATRLYLEQLRQLLIKETGGLEDPNDPNSMFKGAKDEGKVEDLMIGSKKADELQTQVNLYCNQLRKLTGLTSDFPDLALAPKDDPRISKTSEHKRKSYADFTFSGTPMVAAMAVLSNIESDVIKYELRALEDINKQIGGHIITVDQIVPMFRADANTVVAGTKYKAELFLGATSSTSTPYIWANGQPLKVDNNGVGTLEFLASGGDFGNKSIIEKKWSGKITFKNRGKDTTFTIEGKYNVAKPYVDVQASTPPILYRNCANELSLSCPPLGATFNPVFSGSTGGEIIKGNSPGKITIVPNNPEMALNITNNGAKIDLKKFRVVLVPKPTIKLVEGSKEVDLRTGLKLPIPNSLKVVVKADENFCNISPKDCKFNATECMVYVIRGRNPLLPPFVCKNGVIDLFQVRKLNLKDGDRIYIETKKIQRANFRNQIEDVNASQTWNVSITGN